VTGVSESSLSESAATATGAFFPVTGAVLAAATGAAAF